MSVPILIVDTEGSGLYPDDGARISVISWATRRDDGSIDAGALPFGQGPEGQLFDVVEDAGLAEWERLFEWMSTCRLVMHNALHDLNELAAGAIAGYPGRSLVEQFYWDTGVVQRHLDPIERVGLEDSCVRRLGVAPWKAQLDGWKQRNGGRFDLTPWSVINPYATDDAINTLLLFEDQNLRLDAGEGNREIVEREHKITRVLFRMEQRGVSYDAAASTAAGHVLSERAQRVAERLPAELRPVTPERMCAYYYDQLGYAMSKIKDGQPVRSADDLSRKGLADQGAPHIDTLNEWSTLETAYTSWYFPWAAATAPDGRLRMRVRQTKVTSGRFSGERVNLLAIPHNKQLPPGVPSIRSFIHPREGCELWEVDLGQAEVRVGAIAANCKPMIAAFEQGLDPYGVTAKDVFGIVHCSKHADKTAGCEACSNFDHYRSLCKRIVLSTIYSGGVVTLLATVKKFMDLDLEEREGQRFLNAFGQTYPEFKTATAKWETFALAHSYVPLALGERRYFKPFEMICAKCKGAGCRRCKGLGRQAYKALNQRIQGSVAAVMKPCMIEVEEQFPNTMLLQTHDALLLETPDRSVPVKVGAIMKDQFENVFKLPFTVDIKQWAA